MAGVPGHLGGGGVVGGRGGTDAEQSTLEELMRFAAMHAHAAGGASVLSGGGAPVVSGDGRAPEHLMMGAMEDSSHVAYIQGNRHMVQFPAGVGYVTAPLAHHGKSVPHFCARRVRSLCTRTAPVVASIAARSHADRLLRAHPNPQATRYSQTVASNGRMPRTNTTPAPHLTRCHRGCIQAPRCTKSCRSRLLWPLAVRTR